MLPHIQSGKLRALGVASLKRSSLMPELPTIAEQGVPKFEAVSWYALMVPAGTPADVVEKIGAVTTKLLARARHQEASSGSAWRRAPARQPSSR